MCCISGILNFDGKPVSPDILAAMIRMLAQWAFAIWDSRNRTLFISRDRLGIRPMF
jgi:asparagine synthetase B (glutamine-hydrolysing)